MLGLADLLKRYDRPGPRYTSYPPATEFHPGVDSSLHGQHLRRAASVDAPLALYVHLPFCEERCTYCGCTMVATRRRSVRRRYLGALEKELETVSRHLAPRKRLAQVHLGGGTPTYLTPDDLLELCSAVQKHFLLDEDCEMALEADPRVTTWEHLVRLRDLGFDRLSIGVQDFDPDVQAAIGREQSFVTTLETVSDARGLGFSSVNVDLVYGLPKQTLRSFRQTLDKVRFLEPDRIALYGYAHVPWMKGNQRAIDPATLPGAEERIELFAAGKQAFTDDGYVAIGMDHFALPDDELARAQRDGRLWRNFMGYTVRSAPDTIGVGMSSISDVAGGYFQNEKKLVRYEETAEAGELTTERGLVLTENDLVRRHVITAIMCNFQLDVADVERRFGIVFDEFFGRERADLRALEADGLLTIDPGRIGLTELGRIFVRNVCRAFDDVTPAERGFSRTV